MTNDLHGIDRGQKHGHSTAVSAVWAATVRASPRALALVDATTGQSWTRAQLAELGRAWKEAHRASVAGKRVVFAESNGPEWWRVFLGLQESGAVAVALDPGEPVAAQRALATAIGAAWLWREGQLEAAGGPRRGRRRNACLLKLTSGSTGAPKVLPFTAEQMIADARQICASMGIAASDLNLGCIPFGHSYGLGNLVFPLLVQGTAIISGVAALPQALAAAVARWRPTVFPAVPALLRALTEADVGEIQLRSLRTVISAGAPLAPEVAQAFQRKFGRKIHNFYGSSETGGISYDRTGEAALKGRSTGRPLEGVTLRFTPGGRFWVTSAAVGGTGRARPADRGELNAAGELVLLGRAGRMVKLAGRRLDPAEVEHALRRVPGVRDAFVALHPDRVDTLAAVVASGLSPAELRETLRERLATWKLPKKFVVVPEFPLTARGKTDARKIKEMLRGDSEMLPRAVIRQP